MESRPANEQEQIYVLKLARNAQNIMVENEVHLVWSEEGTSARFQTQNVFAIGRGAKVMPANPVYWEGSKPSCELSRNHRIGSEFYDAKTKMGPWGKLCPSCFRHFAVGLGKGKGQKYEKQADGRWLKTGG